MPVKREFSAGGVVFREKNGKRLWLIIEPESGSEHWRKNRWQLPKGWIDEGETSEEAALREVREEGGVEAEIVYKTGSITIFFFDEEKNRVIKNITFYLMRWKKNLPEGPGKETAKALWLPYEKASEKLTFKNEKQILEKSEKRLSEGVQETLI